MHPKHPHDLIRYICFGLRLREIPAILAEVPLANEVLMRLVVDPVEMMHSRIPPEFWVETLRALRNATHVAHMKCSDLGQERQHDLRARVRRAYFEEEWIKIARRFGGVGRSQPNANNVSYHAEVRLGDVVFTHMPIGAPGELPQHANYRETLARNYQGEFWPEFDDPAPPKGTTLYGILLYASSLVDSAGLPIFASVGFPNRRMKQYVASYNLQDVLQQLGAEKRPADLDLLPVVPIVPYAPVELVDEPRPTLGEELFPEEKVTPPMASLRAETKDNEES